MTTTAIARPALRPLTILAPVLLAVFGSFSIWVVATQGYLGFLTLAGREWWALQLLIDLVISVGFSVAWMAGDARKRAISSWPYAIAAVFVGSLAILAYCIRRSVTPPRGT